MAIAAIVVIFAEFLFKVPDVVSATAPLVKSFGICIN